MLLSLRALGDNKWLCAIRKFLYSPYYIALVATLSACSNLFGWEIPVWYTFAFLAIVSALLADDALPFVPLVCFAYISVSVSNNPAGNYGSSLFQDKLSLIQLAVIAALLVGVIVARVTFDLARPKCVVRRRSTPKLGVGLMLLSLSYIIAGLAVTQAATPWKSSLFGLVQAVCLALPYFYFHYTVNWKNVDPTYMPKVFVGLGGTLTAEIVGMYVLAFSSLPQGASFTRGMLYTGWGIYNNVGFLIAFCIPFAFNLALRCRRGWIFLIVADIFETALLFTQSRGSVLFGTIIFVCCAIYTASKFRGKDRIVSAAISFGLFAVWAVFAAIFNQQVAALFADMRNAGTDDSGRWEIYGEGLRQFAQSAQSVLLGNGFYACDNYRWGNLPPDAFLPPRYHNTWVQLLATGGLTAFVAYMFHRYQTLKLCLKKRTYEKIFSLAAILVLALCSLVDCHFFNMGPGLVYSIVLVFTENAQSEQKTSPESKYKQIL